MIVIAARRSPVVKVVAFRRVMMMNAIINTCTCCCIYKGFRVGCSPIHAHLHTCVFTCFKAANSPQLPFLFFRINRIFKNPEALVAHF